MSDPVTIHTDGASRGNPGPAAFAYTIARPGLPAVEEAGCLGQMTNNQAEYIAFVRALERAAALGVEGPVVLKSDSELIVKQMRGEYRVKNEELRPLYEQARRAVSLLAGGVTFEHVRREQNKRTDELCNLALDGGAAKPKASAPREGNALKADAIAVLSEAGALPTAEQVWDELAAVLRRHGLKVPR
ncbi:MAG: ribonuclease HI family protein [Gemmataceae bacterium]